MNKSTTKRIDEVAEVVSGGTPSRENSSFWAEENGVIWVTPSDITRQKGRFLSSSEEMISEEGLKKSSASLLPVGTILMTSRATIGEAKIAAKPVCTNQGFKSLVAKENVNSTYLYYQVSYSKNQFLKYAMGTTFLEINKYDTNRVKLFFPEIQHQKKIAKILSTVDEVIENTEAAINKYKLIKEGMMQDLFTRGVDINTGKLRPKYEDAPELYQETELGWIPKEWEISSIDGITNLRHGYQFRDYDFTEEGTYVVKIGQLHKDGYLDLSRASTISSSRNSEFQNIQLVNGDVLMALTGATLGKTIILGETTQILLQNYRVGHFSPKEDKMENLFMYYLLTGNFIQNEILGLINTGAQGNIGKADFERMRVAFPSDLLEQDKISEKLKGLDDYINSESEILQKYSSLKLGLMQDLLTGTVEVKIES